MPADSDRTRDLLRWLSAIDLPEAVLLACAHTTLTGVPRKTLGVKVVGCISDQDLSLPAQLLASGVNQVQIADCDQDPASAASTLAAWGAVLPEVTRAVPAAKPRRWPQRTRGAVFCLDSPSFSRRSAFGLRAGRELPFDLDLDQESRGVAALRLLQERGRASIEPTAASTPPDTAEIGATAVAVELSAEGCTACGVCVRACPHNALELVTTEGVSVVSHYGDNCRGEQDCVRYCPVGALQANAELSLLDLVNRTKVELARVRTATCTRCGVRHPSVEGELCQACRFRSANAFGTFVPLRARSS